MPPSSPKRMSKSSDGSLLDDLPSTDWSSDSLPEDPDHQSPPPKPPLPLKGLLGDFGMQLRTMPFLKNLFANFFSFSLQ